MESMALDAHPADQLADALRRVASDPGQTAQLYDLLRDYCHQCRNVLNSLKMSLYLARRFNDGADQGPDGLGPSQVRYDALEWLVDRLHQLCRPAELNPVRLPLDLLIEGQRGAWSKVLAARGRGLVVGKLGGSESAVGPFDPMRLEQALNDLVAWRAIAGPPGSDLRLRHGAVDGAFRLDWDEPAGQADPGRRGDERSPPVPLNDELDPDALASAAYAALTAPILTRLMTLHHGSLVTTDVGADAGRWGMSLRWPLDARPT
jgi:hypothetical protein